MPVPDAIVSWATTREYRHRQSASTRDVDLPARRRQVSRSSEPQAAFPQQVSAALGSVAERIDPEPAGGHWGPSASRSAGSRTCGSRTAGEAHQDSVSGATPDRLKGHHHARKCFLPGLVDLTWYHQMDLGEVFDFQLPLEDAVEGHRAKDECRAIKASQMP